MASTSQFQLVLFSVYVILWLGLGIGSWWLIRNSPDAATKTAWHRRSTLALVILVGLAGLLLSSSFQRSGSVPFLCLTFLPFLLILYFINVTTTHFCPACGRRSKSRLFAKVYHCPHCGERLK